MSIVITGATGHLGRHVVESLLARGVPADRIVATGRRVETLADLASRGVVVRRADFDDPSTLGEAFDGAEKVLLVSAHEPGRRVQQHAHAIEAAKAAGTALIAYTSLANADHSTMTLAADHVATERLLAESGVPYVLLRNSFYVELYTQQLPAYLDHGFTGAAGAGKLSLATRSDYAEAAAAALTADGHDGAVLELGGQTVTKTELAAIMSAVTGRDITYVDLPVDSYQAALESAGLPQPMAVLLADIDRGTSVGDLHVDSGDLERLLGRPPTPLADAFAAATTIQHRG